MGGIVSGILGGSNDFKAKEISFDQGATSQQVNNATGFGTALANQQAQTTNALAGQNGIVNQGTAIGNQNTLANALAAQGGVQAQGNALAGQQAFTQQAAAQNGYGNQAGALFSQQQLAAALGLAPQNLNTAMGAQQGLAGDLAAQGGAQNQSAALNFQAALAQQLAGQGGAANQSNVYNQQQAFGQDMYGRSGANNIDYAAAQAAQQQLANMGQQAQVRSMGQTINYNQANRAAQGVQGQAALAGANAYNPNNIDFSQAQGTLGQNQNLVNQFVDMGNGVGPNPALEQLKQTTAQNIQQATGMIASQKGVNPAMAARLAAQAGANANQQAAGQAATLAAQQQIAARNQAAQAIQTQAGMQGQQAQAQQQAQLQNQQLAGQLGLSLQQQYGQQAQAQAAAQLAQQQLGANIYQSQAGLSTQQAQTQAQLQAQYAGMTQQQLQALAGLSSQQVQQLMQQQQAMGSLSSQQVAQQIQQGANLGQLSAQQVAQLQAQQGAVMAGATQQVSQQAQALAQQFGMSAQEVQQLMNQQQAVTAGTTQQVGQLMQNQALQANANLTQQQILQQALAAYNGVRNAQNQTNNQINADISKQNTENAFAAGLGLMGGLSGGFGAIPGLGSAGKVAGAFTGGFAHGGVVPGYAEGGYIDAAKEKAEDLARGVGASFQRPIVDPVVARIRAYVNGTTPEEETARIQAYRAQYPTPQEVLAKESVVGGPAYTPEQREQAGQDLATQFAMAMSGGIKMPKGKGPVTPMPSSRAELTKAVEKTRAEALAAMQKRDLERVLTPPGAKTSPIVPPVPSAAEAGAAEGWKRQYDSAQSILSNPNAHPQARAAAKQWLSSMLPSRDAPTTLGGSPVSPEVVEASLRAALDDALKQQQFGRASSIAKRLEEHLGRGESRAAAPAPAPRDTPEEYRQQAETAGMTQQEYVRKLEEAGMKRHSRPFEEIVSPDVRDRALSFPELYRRQAINDLDGADIEAERIALDDLEKKGYAEGGEVQPSDLDALETEEEYAARKAREAVKIPVAKEGDPNVISFSFDEDGKVVAKKKAKVQKKAEGGEVEPAQAAPAPRQPKFVPMPGRVSGGDTNLPKEILDPEEALYVDPASKLDEAKVRAALDAAALGWGAPKQDWRGLEVHAGTDIPGESERTGRTLVRKREGKVAGGRMDIMYNGGNLHESSLPHEVGHLILGGDYEHKDPRWHSQSFWRGMEKQMSVSPRSLDPYLVDWNGYAAGGKIHPVHAYLHSLHGTQPKVFEGGGHVPGRAEYAGDDERNDKVPAMLSPGEIVVPRSHSGSPEKAKSFIDHLMKRKGQKSGYEKIVAARKGKKE